MVLVLAIGDIHVPNKSIDIPPKFKKLLVPGKISQILLTGNACSSEVLSYLKQISSDVVATKGDLDQVVPAYMQEFQVVEHGSFRIGMLHGHQVIPWDDPQSLAVWARKLDVDIMITGHSHTFHAFESEGRLFVNPGSATGAFSPLTMQKETPSFVLLDIQQNLVNLYVYKLVDGDVQVEKVEFTKKIYD